MRAATQSAARALVTAACAGLALGVCEVCLVVLFDRGLFLTAQELRRYALATLASSVSVVTIGALVVGLLLRGLAAVAPSGAVASRIFASLVLVTSWPVLARVLWSLSAGRRVRAVPGRGIAVVLGALVAAVLVAWFARRVARAYLSREAIGRRQLGLYALAGAVMLGADGLVLRRLYPAFHLAAAGAAVIAAIGCALALPAPRLSGTTLRGLGALGLLTALWAPWSLRSMVLAPNLSFAAGQAAPLTGKLLRIFAAPVQRPAPALSTALASRAPALALHEGPDLRGGDVLLITIDALRADRLAVYGGQGVTPALDALAREAVVFERAYTATPHTSYALGSLLTGKYLREVLELSGGPREHATLPGLLRRFGYRTAAFYPPAVFFVDGARFAGLAEAHFGFEYVKLMFSTAADRVSQLERYLRRVEPGYPLFVWVHLFEPHEPYDPPPAHRRGDSPNELYDGEVRAADAAVGELLRVFRQQRGGATVIVTADHGEELGDHGGYHHGTTLFDEQVRVPLLWSSPKLAPRVVRRVPAQLADVAPTLLSALGVPRDARMRGHDLGPLLSGHAGAADLRAFVSIDELQAWIDGSSKLVCEARRPAASCRLYDLEADPRELRDVAPERPELAGRLRAELAAHVASLPRVEALAIERGVGFPPALARARLGDATAAEEVIALLGDDRGTIRAEAARVLGELRVASALPVLAIARGDDPDSRVRDEAAVASLSLGDEGAAAAVQAILARAARQGGHYDALLRLAALALPAGALHTTPVLLDLAADAQAALPARKRALSQLSTTREARTVTAIAELLSDVRLRPAVAEVLGRVGGAAAADALVRALAQERYVEARSAEALALLRLRDPRAKRLIVRMLGTESGVPGGLLALLDAGAAPAPPGALARDLRALGCARRQAFAADTGRLPRGELRLLVAARAQAQGRFVDLAGERRPVRQGDSEVSRALRPAPGTRSLEVAGDEGVCLLAIALVPATTDVPPPPPEAYDAGAGEEASSDEGGTMAPLR